MIQAPLGIFAAVAGTHNEDSNGCGEACFLTDFVVSSFEPVIVPLPPPAQRVGDSGLPAEADLAMMPIALSIMNPWAHDHVDGTLQPLAQNLKICRSVACPRVIPAAHEIYGDVLVTFWEVDDVVLLPVRIVYSVAHGFYQPLFILGSQAQGSGAFSQRKVSQIMKAILGHLSQCRSSIWISGSTRSSAGVQQDPIPEAKLKGSSVAHTGIAKIRHGVDRNDCLQIGTILHGHGVLRASKIRGANHADLLVGPGLLADPGRSVIAVPAVIR